jgi:hypothetical protein
MHKCSFYLIRRIVENDASNAATLPAERQASSEAEMTSAALILQATWLLKRSLNFEGTNRRSGVTPGKVFLELARRQ